MSFAILWFRQDLRLADNPALCAALTEHQIIPLYILDETQTPPWGGASRWWLHHALASLDRDLRKLGSRLVLRRGDPLKIIPELMHAWNAAEIYLNRCYEPHAVARDMQLKENLGAAYHSYNANLLFEPWEIKTQEGNPCRVFTPYWKNCMSRGLPDAPLAAPKSLPPVDAAIASDDLNDWQLLPQKPDWAGGLRQDWRAGETAARERLKNFLSHQLSGYADGRNTPSENHTSHLSPHLHWGEISPRQVFHAVQTARASGEITAFDADKFLSEIGWREFSYHLLYHNPHLPSVALQPKFRDFPWQENMEYLHAWQRGQTGYPMVDAGMRELWHTGYMHNRVRMIAASFLVKNLLQPWQLGAAWFWDTLVDADLANNSASWQWVAGCGADAAPYYRIFNPVLQGEKFDPRGAYIRRWIPELSDVPDKYIHQPWMMPDQPGAYSKPIIDFKTSRNRALSALTTLKGDPS